MTKLLTTNTKLLKGNGLPCYGVQLAPHRLSGYNVCPMASDASTPSNIEDCLEALEDTATVAVPFNRRNIHADQLPKQWQGFKVVDGDVDDRIWNRKPGTINGLRFKGDVSNINMGCKDYCIYGSGHGRFDNVKDARTKRTKMLFEDRDRFFSQLYDEIGKAQKKHGTIALRMNVFSDIAWETQAFADPDGKTVYDAFPNVQGYDYTKIPKRVQQFLKGTMPPNYYLCLSYNKVAFIDGALKAA